MLYIHSPLYIILVGLHNGTHTCMESIRSWTVALGGIWKHTLYLIFLHRNHQNLLLLYKQGSPKDGYILAFVIFKKILFFSQLHWYIKPDQNCTLPLVKNGKIGNTSFCISNLNILGYMHIISIRTTFVPS